MHADKLVFIVILAVIATVQIWLVRTTLHVSRLTLHPEADVVTPNIASAINAVNRSAHKATRSANDIALVKQQSLSTASPAAQQEGTYIYERFPLIDIDSLDLGHIDSKDITTLERVCSMLENCKGFNSNGWLKQSTDGRHRVPSQGTLFVKTIALDGHIAGQSGRRANHQPLANVQQQLAAQSSLANPASQVDREHQTMKIFMYDYSGLNSDFPWVQDYKYGVEEVFTKLLLKSTYLTTNPDEATFFMLPIRCSSYRKSMADRQAGQDVAERITQLIVEDIKRAHPYWNRTLGADHFFICGHDMGASVTGKADPNLHKNAIALVNTAEYDDPYFITHKDIGLPPHVGDGCPTCTQGAGLDQPAPSTRNTNRPILAMFAGNLQRGSVRQAISSKFQSDADFRLVDGIVSTEKYHQLLLESKFCLVLHGYRAWSPRLMDALWFGCVPVIVADHYHLPLHGLLDWNRIAIIVPHSQVPNLKEILMSVVENKTLFDSMQASVWRERTRFIWNDPPVEGDAFDSVMSLLWLRRHVLRY